MIAVHDHVPGVIPCTRRIWSLLLFRALRERDWHLIAFILAFAFVVFSSFVEAAAFRCEARITIEGAASKI
jgi:hypothetical protein